MVPRSAIQPFTFRAVKTDNIGYIDTCAADNESTREQLSTLVEANGFNPKEKPKKKIDGKKFILKHTEDFLHHAVEYSMNDVGDEFYQE